LNHKLCKLCKLSTVNCQLSTVNHHPSTNQTLPKRPILFLLLFFQIGLIRAQTDSDSSRPVKVAGPDSIVNKKPDTTGTRLIDQVRGIRVINIPVKKIVDSLVIYRTDSLRFSATKPPDFSQLPIESADLLKAQPFFNFSGRAIHIRAARYEPVTYEGMFYFLVIMLFYFAIIKLFFAKYLANLLTLFFKASIRQQQLREQVLQSPFPSLLLNNLFVFAGGLYGAFLLKYYHFGDPDHFWLHFLYCAVLLTILYLLKYLILRITGWIFNINRAVETYLFVVFMTNKIIGIFLLPFLVLISFAGTGVMEIGITLSVIMICIFYIYRFVASYSTLRKEIKISGLHFFLYLCAFEIAPLLLIYKVLVAYLEKAY
jgi:hypothetical protein